MPSAAFTAPLVVILVLVGFGFVFTQLGGSSSSSSSVYAAAGSASSSVPASAAGTGRNAAGHNTAGSTPDHDNVSRNGVTFVLTQSGTRYQGSTLASQVRAQLDTASDLTPAATAPGGTASADVPSASASASSAPVVEPASLRGCVSRLTGGVSPSLVDRASYDGTPAYIVAVPEHAWVVRLNCTAADLQEITSVSLGGLSGVIRESPRPRIG
jgi:hypothetical protein